MSRLFTLLSSLVLAFGVAHAQTSFTGLKGFIDSITTNIVASLGYLALASAVVVFFFGIVQFIWAARSGEAKAMEEGKSFMVWGLIALFVMFSVWGIVRFAQEAIGSRYFQDGDIIVPRIRFGESGGGSTQQQTSPLGTGGQSTAGTGSQADGQPCETYPGDRDHVYSNGRCVLRPTTGTSGVNTTCQAWGVGTGCTTTNAAGVVVSGTCNTSNQCVPAGER